MSFLAVPRTKPRRGGGLGAGTVEAGERAASYEGAGLVPRVVQDLSHSATRPTRAQVSE